MHERMKRIELGLPYGMGSVNCYLIGTERGFVLIDTAGRNGRRELVGELEEAGCKPGDLKLILLTHGDFDHAGNAAHLRETFGGRIAIHREDVGMIERGDMFASRSRGNFLLGKILSLFVGFGRSERFTPDMYLEEGDDLSPYGFDARVVSIPGHTRGSIGILSPANDLFCGDLLVNKEEPSLNSLVDDGEAMRASLRKLEALGIGTVYPGHGEPFPIDRVWQRNP